MKGVLFERKRHYILSSFSSQETETENGRIKDITEYHDFYSKKTYPLSFVNRYISNAPWPKPQATSPQTLKLLTATGSV